MLLCFLHFPPTKVCERITLIMPNILIMRIAQTVYDFCFKKKMQFIQVNNHRTYFSTLEDQVNADNPVRLMNALINELDLQNLGFTGTLHKSEAIKKQALCLLANLTTKTDNSITSRLPRLRSTSL